MKTDQEKFWSSDFGNKYTERTHLERKYFTTRVKMWSDILMHSNDIKSVFEIGSNTGINMEVIQFLLNKKISTNGIEINKKASLIAKKNKHKIKNISVLDYKPIKKFDMSVVPIFIERVDDTNFQISIYKPLKFLKDDSILDITNKLNKVLEDMIRKNPGQWIWSHNRWK